MFKKVVLVSTLIGVISGLLAAPVVPREKFEIQLKKEAGKPGQFISQKEKFPKDYFLVNNNLPFLAGLSLHHPKSSMLELTKEQIKAIQKIKKVTVPAVVKKSKEIKKLELELAQNIAVDSNNAKSQFALVDKISKLRTELTKAHLQCINNVREVLTKEQYKKLLTYATKLVKKKSNKFKTDELVILPHPGKFIKMGKININKEQKQRMNKEVKAVFVGKFQQKSREAFELEKKVQRMVAKGKTKEELKELLDTIAKLKREAIDHRIDALNQLQKIFTKEQWKKTNKLTYK